MDPKYNQPRQEEKAQWRATATTRALMDAGQWVVVAPYKGWIEEKATEPDSKASVEASDAVEEDEPYVPGPKA